MKLTTRGRFGAAVLSWITALGLLAIAPLALATEPVANAGEDFVVNDSGDGNGEHITLSAEGSIDPDGDSITMYHWYRIIGHGGTVSMGSSTLPQLNIWLADGSYNILLEVTDSSGETGSDNVFVQILPRSENQPPTVNAGPDRTVGDGDNQAGERVRVSADARDPEGQPLSYTWYRVVPGDAFYLSSEPSPTLELQDGQTVLQVQVSDPQGAYTSDEVVITVNAPRPPIANAGIDRTVADSNGAANELVTLDGSGSSDPDGTIASYTWYRVDGGNLYNLGSSASPTLSATLPDGQNTIRLDVTDNWGNPASDTVLITVRAPVPPTANAGADRVIDDTDTDPGERVVLDGSASNDPDGSIVRYEWFEGDASLGVSTTPTLPVQLSDGSHTIRLTVTDNFGATGSDQVQITVDPPPVDLQANAGPDRTVADSDTDPGELVRLDGSRSTFPEGSTVHYYWTLTNGGIRQELGDSATPTLDAPLPDGENVIELLITGSSEDSSTDTVTITVVPPAAPTANAGADRTINDSDRAPGENVVLDGSASTGNIVNYTWSRVNGETSEELGSGTTATLNVNLPDGENVIRLVVTDNAENTASDTVTITVGAPTSSGPTANAGADRVIADSDKEVGEDVVLDGSYSLDPDGTIVDYAWSRVEGETVNALGNGVSPMLRTRLPDGDSVIQLVVTDNSGATATDTALITVSKSTVTITKLGDLPGLTPNQQQVGQALDRVCAQLRDRSGGEGPQLSGDQQDLLARCDGLQMNNTTENQVAALDELVADDFAVARTQTLLFANTQYAGVMDRLMALRGGAKGLSLAGLNIMVDGSPVPLAQLQDMVKDLLGGGASADEPGDLLSDKWGLWARGNLSFGEKERNTRSPGFEADQWAMVGGVDYRFNDQIVGGVSLAHGQSSIEIDNSGGGLETDSYAVSLYGSSYVAKQYYLDAIINVANADYAADRNIVYIDGAGLVDVDARGDTSGMTYSAGISGGRDFLYGGFTVSPTLGVFYIDATIDSFTERGAAGLNLIYDEQSFQSFTGNLGFRVTYAWNQSWGVLLPHLRVEYIREFKNDVDVFGVRFAADPNATSAPPILVATDNPDESYWRLATGMSAQFVHGISGYVEYQRLESFEFISFQDVSLGLRFQKSF